MRPRFELIELNSRNDKAKCARWLTATEVSYPSFEYAAPPDSFQVKALQMIATIRGSLPLSISKRKTWLKDWTSSKEAKSSLRIMTLALGYLTTTRRSSAVLMSSSESSRTVRTNVNIGYVLSKYSVAGMAREPFAPVKRTTPVMTLGVVS
jgi:hypothetical protein